MYYCINTAHTLFSGYRIEWAKIITFCFAYPRHHSNWNAQLKITIGFSFYPFVPYGTPCQLSQHPVPWVPAISVTGNEMCTRFDEWCWFSWAVCSITWHCPEAACPWHSRTFWLSVWAVPLLLWREAALLCAGSTGKKMNTIMPG